MADLSKRIPGCDDDCDGEGGERGERGKRGKRGPRGHDGRDGRDGFPIVTDPTPPTLRGDGSPENPLQVINVAVQPFVSPLEHRIIFANAAGSDEFGDGSEAKPYRTFQRATLDVTRFIPEGVVFTIDITGLGTEPLPPNYALPVWIGVRSFSFAEVDDGFLLAANVRIVADLQLASALTPAERTVTPTSVVVNPVTRTMSVEDTSQNWGVDALKGLFATFEVDGEPHTSIIFSNTNDTIFLTGNDSSPVPPTVGSTVSIVEPSARFLTTNNEFGFTGGFKIGNTSLVYFEGIAFDSSDGNSTLYCYNSSLWFEKCSFVQPFFDTAPRQYYAVACDMTQATFQSPMYLAQSLIRDSGVQPFQRPAQSGMLIHSGSVLQNTSVQIGDGLVDGVNIGGLLTMINVLIQDAPGDGIKLLGGNATIVGVEINDSAGNAIYFSGPGKHFLKNVAGSGNAGVGVFVDDGAQVETLSVAGTGDSLEFFTDDGGVVVLTDAGANFEQFVGLSEGPRMITITGATDPDNNGSFVVIAVLDANNIVFANPDGVTEAFAGNWVVDPVTVTGMDDQQVGDLGPGPWPPPPYNIVDMYTGVNPNVVGTGGRLFNR